MRPDSELCVSVNSLPSQTTEVANWLVSSMRWASLLLWRHMSLGRRLIIACAQVRGRWELVNHRVGLGTWGCWRLIRPLQIGLVPLQKVVGWSEEMWLAVEALNAG